MLQKKQDEVRDDERQQAKQICYGIVYGMGCKSLAEQLEVGEEEAQLFVNTLHATYPSKLILTSSTRMDLWLRFLVEEDSYQPSIATMQFKEAYRDDFTSQYCPSTVDSNLIPPSSQSRLKLDQFSGVQNRPRIQFLSMYSSSLASSCGAESRKPSNTEDTQGKEDGIQNLELDWALFCYKLKKALGRESSSR
ncbi:hypothetical protein OUZ56_017712 [Daphnia magna]|uniref:DNA-directed DNA polymerase n=1 Tax=Daphnia magna TaxID=35525 RepID=A0ABR0ATJ2_9CRUS|nr:hypothetical protein OUZ56_017712 [Daphnia magna]